MIEKAIAAVENADEEFFSALPQKQLAVYRSLTMAIIVTHDGRETPPGR